ncbi:hypothetical protein [Maritalea porphyrae]|uniref:hypothetical protein n=1 Tax=Maritalea porphyrae TaxID=880732 RepID=UPI0022AF9739|nr:hypothetical protein [Maritalea porphyrae]MCZ4273996.1 hypothetical protein [Maritalea porphyrae]
MTGSPFHRLAARSANIVDRVFAEPVLILPVLKVSQFTGLPEIASNEQIEARAIINFTPLEGRLDGSRPGNQEFNHKINWTRVQATLSDDELDYTPSKDDQIHLPHRADAPLLVVHDFSRDENGRLVLELAST